jgi:glutathione S-transferase
MLKLIHFRLCPASRAIRLALGELGLEAELVEEKPWELSTEFLGVNPAGELPVLAVDKGPQLAGAYAIAEYLAEEPRSGARNPRSTELFPGTREERAEVRRLVDWSLGKLQREVTRELLYEKIYARMRPGSGHTPDREMLTAIKANLRYHMGYVAFLAEHRKWLAGDDLSFADLAAGAHLSSIDYLGDVPWEEYPSAKGWYQRLKSRPSFRSLLADRVPGMPPPAHYANLDF